jgi:hypothetical protein
LTKAGFGFDNNAIIPEDIKQVRDAAYWDVPKAALLPFG